MNSEVIKTSIAHQHFIHIKSKEFFNYDEGKSQPEISKGTKNYPDPYVRMYVPHKFP